MLVATRLREVKRRQPNLTSREYAKYSVQYTTGPTPSPYSGMAARDTDALNHA